MSRRKANPTAKQNLSPKTPRESTLITRKIVGHDMLNPNGTLFGGVIMSWIDEVAFMTARRHAGRPFVVTVNIDNISFIIPLRQGEHVILSSHVNYVGRTSMEIGVRVDREDPYTGERVQATSAYLTFVALDEKSKPCPVPPLLLENTEDQRRHEEALVRVKVRERIKAHFKRKLELNKMRTEAETEATAATGPTAPANLPLKTEIKDGSNLFSRLPFRHLPFSDLVKGFQPVATRAWRGGVQQLRERLRRAP